MCSIANTTDNDAIMQEAKKCALATIHHIYEEYSDHASLSDVEIDKVKDCMQILTMCNQLRKTMV